MMRAKICRSIWLLLICLVAGSIPLRSEQLSVKKYTIADGLARDFINRIRQDSHGYVWFCTTEGISRFDGYTFTNYGVAEGLPHRIVNDVIETRDGEILFATLAGVVQLNVERGDATSPHFMAVSLEVSDEKSLSATRLVEDRDGSVWVGTAGGLFRLTKADGRWRSERVRTEIDAKQNVDLSSINTLLIDRNGTLWVGSAFYGVFRRRSDGGFDRFTEKNGLAQNGISDIYQDRSGKVWVGTGNGLTLLVDDPKPGESVSQRNYLEKDGLLTNFIETIFESSDGRIWIGTRGGLNLLSDPKTNSGRSFIGYTPENGLQHVRITTIMEDTDNNLWLGAESGGAVKMPLVGFTSYFGSDGLGTARISQILAGPRNEPYFLTTRSGSLTPPIINRFDGRTLVNETPPSLENTTLTWGWNDLIAYDDESGEWWIATANGVFRYLARGDLSTASLVKVYTVADGLDDNFIFRLWIDAGRNLWISTIGGDSHTIVHRLSRETGRITAFDVVDKALDSAATAFADGGDGSVWIGLYSGGLLRYKDGKMSRLTIADGVPAGFVRDLFVDSRQRLWVGTSIGGVGRIDDISAEKPAITVMTVRDGLSSDQVTNVIEDKFGRIYFGTGRGIDRFDPETGRMQHFTTADGLADNFVNVASSMKDGTLWFGTLYGLSSFTPQPDRPRTAPKTLISSVTVNGERRSIGELGKADVQLPDLDPSANQVEIDFVSLSFAAGERLTYQYRFGDNENWSLPTQDRKVTLPNLSSGQFRFEVRAVNSAGQFSEQPARVSFRILSPIYLRWWFIAIAAILLIMLIYGSYSYRTARLREINAALEEARSAEERLRLSREERISELESVRSRIATDLHDDIGASLTQIAVLSEVAQTQARNGTFDEGPLTKISDVSNELVGTMSDIVWSINPAKDHLSDLTQRMRRFAADILAARSIRFHFAGSDTANETVIGSNLRREIFLIFKESINNVVKHSNAKNVRATLVVADGRLRLSIEDDGSGFETAGDNNRTGNGLKSMERRSREMGGELSISSKLGGPTIVVAEFPVES